MIKTLPFNPARHLWVGIMLGFGTLLYSISHSTDHKAVRAVLFKMALNMEKTMKLERNIGNALCSISLFLAAGVPST